MRLFFKNDDFTIVIAPSSIIINISIVVRKDSFLIFAPMAMFQILSTIEVDRVVSHSCRFLEATVVAAAKESILADVKRLLKILIA